MENLEVEGNKSAQVEALTALKQSGGWKIMFNELNRMIKEANIIVNTVGADNKVEFSKRDVSLIKKMAALELRNLPDRMIHLLNGTEQPKSEQPDAFQSEDEISDQEFNKDDF